MPKKPFLAIECLPCPQQRGGSDLTAFRITEQSPKIRKALAKNRAKFNCTIKGIEVFVYSYRSPAIDTNMTDPLPRRAFFLFYLRGSCKSCDDDILYIRSGQFWLVEEVVKRINLLMFEPPRSGYRPTKKRELLEA